MPHPSLVNENEVPPIGCLPVHIKDVRRCVGRCSARATGDVDDGIREGGRLRGGDDHDLERDDATVTESAVLEHVRDPTPGRPR